MSRTTDERVVEMRLDNAQFERNARSSLSTIDKLKQGLNFTGVDKGLERIGAAAKNFDMSGIGSAVQTVHAKFSALEVVAVTALANITNSVINTGKQMLKSLTIDPIREGFSEYELKMNSVQTIMAGTGADLDTVMQKLNELNAYADKTIYSFSDMTSNIGKFTNAGVGLDESVAAIQGVANVAAVSGANANEASRAMYNLAQALSAGYVKLIDWKSIEYANMATVEFKQQLIDTAVEMGTLVKVGDKYQSTTKDLNGHMSELFNSATLFNESLSSQWMTTDVLTKTLGEYADETTEIGKKAFAAAQDVKTFSQLMDTLKEAVGSGWAETWEIVFGDYEEAKKLWTNLSNVMSNIFAGGADDRNAMLKEWKDMGGRDSMIQAAKNAFGGLSSIVKPIKEAFREIFPPLTAKKLLEFTKGIEKLTAKFKIGDDTADKLKRTFKGVFAIFDIGIQTLSALAKGFGELISFIAPVGDGILGFTAGLGDFIVGLNESAKSTEIFGNVVEKVKNFLIPVAKKIKDFAKDIIDAFSSLTHADTSGIDNLTEKAKNLLKPFEKVSEIAEKIFSKIKSVVEKILPLIKSIPEKIGQAVENIGVDGAMDLVNGGLLAGLLYGIKKFIDTLSSIANNSGGILGGIKKLLNNISGGLSKTFNEVSGCLEAMQSSLKADTLLKIAGALGILTISIIALSMIDSEKLTTSLSIMTVMLGELIGSMAIFEKIIEGTGIRSIGKIAIALSALSVSVLVLTFAMSKIASLDWEGVKMGLTGVATLSAILVASSKLLAESSDKMIRGAAGMIAFSVAIRILASSVEKLGKIDTDKLVRGLVSVGVLCAELALFLKFADINKMSFSKSVGFIALAMGIKILASAVDKFASMDLFAMINGIVGVEAVLSELILFLKTTGDSKKVISTAIGLSILGVAMMIFAKAVKNMGSMPVEQMGKGLLGMAGALTIIAVALKFIPKNTITIGLGLIAISTALVILSSALTKLGTMSWEGVAKSLVTLAGALAIITVSMQFMSKALSGAAALLIIAASLAIFVPVLKSLGDMSLERIGKSLLTLAAIFAIVGVAGLVLAPLTPTLLALGGAMALFGIGILAIGAGVLAFTIALGALEAAVAGGAAALVTLFKSILDLIPLFYTRIGQGLVAFADAIANGAPAIMRAITAILVAISRAIIEASPDIVEALMTLLMELFNAIVEYVPQMVEGGMVLILGILEGISNHISEVVQKAIEVVLNFIAGITESLPQIIQAGYDLIIALVNGIADAIEKNTGPLVEAFFNLAGAMIQGLLDGLWAGVESVGDAVVGIGEKAVNKLKDVLGIHSPSRVFKGLGEFATEGFAQGINGKFRAVKDSLRQLADGAISVMDSNEYRFKLAGKSAAERIGSGINSGISDINGLQPVVDISGTIAYGNKAFNNLFDGLSKKAAEIAPNISSESTVTVNHTFDKLVVQGVNDKNEFVASADYAVEELLTSLIRRQNRL